MIGILGGLGPLAGVDLAAKLTMNTAAHSDQEHVPFILLSHPRDIPDRTQYLLGNEKVNPAIAISKKLLQLEQMGAKVGAIACNTAHAPVIFDEITRRLAAAGSQMRLLHLIRETATYIREHHPNSRVGVLSTLGTWQFGLYRNELEEGGLSYASLPEHWARRVHDAVYHPRYGIKSQPAAVPTMAKKELHGALDELIRAKASCVVLGCTEIPLAITAQQYRGMPLLDPIDIVAKALITNVSVL